VARWWREPADPASVAARYGPAVAGSDPTELFVVELAGSPVGMVQRYRVDDDPSWRRALSVVDLPEPAAGIDYLIGLPALIGRGIGTAMIRRAVEELWAEHPEVASVVVAVAQGNRRSWRALERCGFARRWSGELRSDDPSDDGPAHLYVRERPGGRAVSGERGTAGGRGSTGDR
jgi:aminoglycoside 6'-N-acetyltransferase